MAKANLIHKFENFLKKEPLFVNKDVLLANYTPENIPHRDEQINQIANILAPCLRKNKPSNLFIYGKTGTGKTAVTKFVNIICTGPSTSSDRNPRPKRIFSAL